MSVLFSPLSLRELTLRNRIVMSPMCMYSAAEDGLATDWHLMHYGARAMGGVGLIILEATAVEPRGRISENDLGLWCDEQVAPLARLVRLCREQGAAVAVQLGHAGRKAWSPAYGVGPESAVAPSAIAQGPEWRVPLALSLTEIEGLVDAWRAAARRALDAGFDALELHGAHGYLLHQFLSPISNRRDDRYGGDLSGRMRLLIEVADAVRSVWPAERPLLVRLSCSDFDPAGLTPDDVGTVAGALKERGVDAIDCSSGGIRSTAPPRIGPGYQVPLSAHVRRAADLPTFAVGLITRAEQAEQVLLHEQADGIALGRVLLRDPYWPLHAARALGEDLEWPRQYRRARVD